MLGQASFPPPSRDPGLIVADVVGQLVDDRHHHLVAQRCRIGERSLERLAKNHDPVGSLQAIRGSAIGQWGAFVVAEEVITVVRVAIYGVLSPTRLVFDHHRHVVQHGYDRCWERPDGVADDSFEPLPAHALDSVTNL